MIGWFGITESVWSLCGTSGVIGTESSNPVSWDRPKQEKKTDRWMNG